MKDEPFVMKVMSLSVFFAGKITFEAKKPLGCKQERGGQSVLVVSVLRWGGWILHSEKPGGYELL